MYLGVAYSMKDNVLRTYNDIWKRKIRYGIGKVGTMK